MLVLHWMTICVAEWCSGSTRDSESRNPGSNPGSAAKSGIEGALCLHSLLRVSLQTRVVFPKLQIEWQELSIMQSDSIKSTGYIET